MTLDEQSCFDWFMERTTKKFAGLFASDFWETLVLQASAQEPAVRHAIVALAAAHRFDRGYVSWKLPAIYGFDAERFTLQQYNKAIHHLRSRTGTTHKHTLRVALITCMVFVTLEYLRGQYQMGSAHLCYGVQLLSNMSSPQPRSLMSPNVLSSAEDFPHTTLIDAYARLTIQAAMFGQIPSAMCIVARDPQIHAIPYTFPSLLEARRNLDDLLNRVHCLKRYYYNLRATQQEKPDTSLVDMQQKIVTDLSIWRKAFNASIPRLNEEASHTQKFGNILLCIYHEMATIMASVCLSDDEMIFDEYTENFVAILTGFHDLWNFWASLSLQVKGLKTVFSCPESDISWQEFTVESGFIPPVYYTALKCRVPRIRRQALRIVNAAPHREGVWNGRLLAFVLDEVIRIEEVGLQNEEIDDEEPLIPAMPSFKDFPAPDIKASSRISDVAVLLPDRVDGDTFMSYKKLDGDRWSSYKQKVRMES